MSNVVREYNAATKKWTEREKTAEELALEEQHNAAGQALVEHENNEALLKALDARIARETAEHYLDGTDPTEDANLMAAHVERKQLRTTLGYNN
jgi:hypothetical protein